MMVDLIPWTRRTFNFDQPLRVFPALLERLRGTPAQASEIVTHVPEEVLSNQFDGKWAAKEHLGHLVYLDTLDRARLQEFLNRVATLSPADPLNQATEDAGHRRTSVEEILRRMRSGRHGLICKLEQLTEENVAITAVHPRLQRPVRLQDWVWFVAEHDDHHLAQARRVIQDQLRSNHVE